MDLDELKSQLPLEAVWSIVCSTPWPVAGRKALCPLHEDTHPSCHLYPDRWWCFTCNDGGDVIDLVARTQGLSFRDAVAWLGGQFDLDVRLAVAQAPSPEAELTHLSFETHASVTARFRADFAEAPPEVRVRLADLTFYAHDELIRQWAVGELDTATTRRLLLSWWRWAAGRATLPGELIALHTVVGDPRNRDETQEAGNATRDVVRERGPQAGLPSPTARGGRVRGRGGRGAVDRAGLVSARGRRGARPPGDEPAHRSRKGRRQDG